MIFNKGDLVKVTNDPVFEGQICEFYRVKPKGECVVRIPEGRLVCISPLNLTLYWTKEQRLELKKAHLTQLLSLAVDMGDKEWFEQLGKELENIEGVRTEVES